LSTSEGKRLEILKKDQADKRTACLGIEGEHDEYVVNPELFLPQSKTIETLAVGI
jgi:hypothetical protein